MTAKLKKIEYIKSFFSGERSKLMSFIRSHLNEAYYDEDPEDIIQDVAENMLSRMELNIPVDNLAGYIYRSIRNRIIDLYRKPKLKTSIENYTNDNDDNNLLNTLSTEEDLYEFEEEDRWELVNMAIKQLSPEQQDIIIETELNGKSFKELSEKWNTSMGTLLSRKHRAIANIQKILQDYITN